MLKLGLRWMIFTLFPLVNLNSVFPLKSLEPMVFCVGKMDFQSMPIHQHNQQSVMEKLNPLVLVWVHQVVAGVLWD